MDKATIQRKLEEQIAQTQEKIVNYESLIGSVTPDDAIGRISRMDAINNQAVVEASLRQARAKLARLQHGLANIDDMAQGKCKRCGRPIPPMRMILMPESPFCVRCA